MPFEFTGKTPSFGSTSDAFKPLSFGASSTVTSPRPLSFGSSLSFGNTPAVSKPASFASATSAQTTPLASSSFTSVDQGVRKASQSALAKLSSSNDTLSRAHHRANLAQPAIIGNSEIAADKLVAGYLKAVDGKEDVDAGGNFDKLARDFADSSPETLTFLRYVFDNATNYKETEKAKLGSPKSPPYQAAEVKIEQTL